MSSIAAPDPRFTLAHAGLAELALEGVVRASAFAAVRPMHCRGDVCDLTRDADPASPRIDQLIHGEAFDVLEVRDGRAFGRARRDGVVGWADLDGLGEGAPTPDRQVIAPGGRWPLNSLLAADEAAVGAPAGTFADDPVAVAESLLGVPHALGARSSLSTDCAGLVQQCLYACGLAGPRYADQQAELGRAVDGAPRRGDLAVWLHPEGGPGWSGHSALMLDAERVIHATGAHGGVVIESLADADARYQSDGFAAPLFRRLSAS